MADHLSAIVKPLAAFPAQSAQRAGPQDTVLNSTGELLNRYEFGEQPHRVSDIFTRHDASSREHPSKHQTQQIAQHITIISDNKSLQRGDGAVGEVMANQSWREGSAVATTNRGDSPSGTRHHVKRAGDELIVNEERSLSSQLENTHVPRNRPYDTQPQHLNSFTFPLIPHHTPPVHAATAAEIALGISPPFFSRQETRMDVVHDSRHRHRIRALNVDTGGKPADISSVIESLSEVKDRDEENTSRTSETGVVTSPGRMTPLNDSSEHGPSDNPRFGSMGIGTPSTVSTAPSTDDASLSTDYRLDDSHLPNLLQGHTRSQSWGDEILLLGGNPYMPQLQERQWMQGPPISQYTGGQHWSSEVPHNTISSFGEIPHGSGRDQMWPSPQYAQHHHSLRRFEQPQDPIAAHPNHPDMRQQPMHPSHQYGPYQQAARRAHGGPAHGAASISVTPPRPRATPRQLGPPGPPSHRQPTSVSQAGSPHQTGSNTSRSSSEILKTLLRKKACLYEPDTSRSVALVTWLVGRELALEHGFFSRQQLQSGVHACVSDKIESGIITRTKVNRCMQIILNSCFHYIIPRSDGTEEKGDSFRVAFSQTVQDDSFLLQHLPVPWHNLEVNREAILLASMMEEDEKPHGKAASTPKSSPRLSGLNPPLSPGSKDLDDADSKRAVLLCFNENVRSAEDVFRCHNEFIRDTANAAQLQLTAQEWRVFFGREAARAPYLWGNIGIPIPSSEATSIASRQHDALGQLSDDEVAKFRTTWCAKRYDHDHELCGFSHVEVSGGWLRRNPSVYHYDDQMCPHVFSTTDKRVSQSSFFLNECPNGIFCEKAHSMEEILYHPRRYKTRNCTSATARSNWCHLGDICPHLHYIEGVRTSSKKLGESRSHAPRHSKKLDQGSTSNLKTGASGLPCAPMVYASPAPISSFERHLGMPGLQNLFRRNCSVVRAHVHNSGQCSCVYHSFGDDCGIGAELAQERHRGLPNPLAC